MTFIDHGMRGIARKTDAAKLHPCYRCHPWATSFTRARVPMSPGNHPRFLPPQRCRPTNSISANLHSTLSIGGWTEQLDTADKSPMRSQVLFQEHGSSSTHGRRLFGVERSAPQVCATDEATVQTRILQLSACKIACVQIRTNQAATTDGSITKETAV